MFSNMNRKIIMMSMLVIVYFLTWTCDALIAPTTTLEPTIPTTAHSAPRAGRATNRATIRVRRMNQNRFAAFRCYYRQVLPTVMSAGSIQDTDDESWGKSNAVRQGDTTPKTKKKVVIIGGGWAGFSAADALATATVKSSSSSGAGADGKIPTPLEIVLLDASPRGKGGLAGGWRTSSGRPVETGIHGFWREYRNTFAAMNRIKGVNLDDVLTPYTPSVLVSKNGRVALAPVLNKNEEENTNFDGGKCHGFNDVKGLNLFKTSPSAFLESISELLPPPLDIAILSEFSPSSPLTVADRISALGLLGAWADFRQEDPDSWYRYDDVTAEELFKDYAGVSDGLYDEVVTPLLHVLPMAPGYDCSAAAALSCFHVFALQSRGAFDVRWCRGGIAEKIFNPWTTQLTKGGNVKIRGGAKVTSIEAERQDALNSSPSYRVIINNGEEIVQCDAIVLAVGGTAVGRLAASSPPIAKLKEAKDFDKLRGVTCVAVRMFLKPDVVTSGLSGGMYDSTQSPPSLATAMKDSPVVVCGPMVGAIPELEETGFCLYDLQRMHDEFAVKRIAAEEDSKQEPCAVLEVDFFRADSIADMQDDYDVANIALRAVAAALDVPQIEDEQIVDLAVVRARRAVSHFAPKSASYSPGVKVGNGIYMCGDWIDRTGHASWSTEKAVVTGRQAAGAVAKDLGITCVDAIIPAVPDTPQLSTLRRAVGFLRSIAPLPGRGIPPSPWMFVSGVSKNLP